MSVGTATVAVDAAGVAVDGARVRVLVAVGAAAVAVATLVAVALTTVAVVLVAASVAEGVLAFTVTVLVAVAGVPVIVTVRKPVGVSGSIVIVCVMFSVGTGTMYGVSVGRLGFAAAAVARAGAFGFEGKLGAVVGMMIWIAPVPLSTAVAVRSVTTTLAIGVSVCWTIAGWLVPEKMLMSVIME